MLCIVNENFADLIFEGNFRLDVILRIIILDTKVALHVSKQYSANIFSSIYSDLTFGARWKIPCYVPFFSEWLIKVVLLGGDELWTICFFDLAIFNGVISASAPAFIKAFAVDIVPLIFQALLVVGTVVPGLKGRSTQVQVPAVKAVFKGCTSE